MKISPVILIATVAVALGACSSSSPNSSGTTDAGNGIDPSNGIDAGDSGAVAQADAGRSSGNADASTGSTGGADAGAAANDAGGSSVVDAATPPNDVKAVLTFPSTFSGMTRELDLVAVKSLPILGPPSSLYQLKNPTITPGESLTIHGDSTGLSGTNYVVVVLYMQDGGTFLPTNGVDYEGKAATTFDFNGAPLDVGTIEVTLASADAGI